MPKEKVSVKERGSIAGLWGNTAEFICADLKNGIIDMRPVRSFCCFYIVEHTDDKAIISDQAKRLILLGCRNFDFYGAKEPAWHLGFDEADILLFPDAGSEEIALTSGWDTLEEFVEVLYDALSCRLPCDCYLFYDDVDIYIKALSLLRCL